MTINRFINTLTLFLATSVLYAQPDNFHYRMELSGTTNEWHSIYLPNEIFGNVLPDFHDIRVIGYTEQGDTIEAPFIIHKESGSISTTNVPFRLINQTHSNNRYYSTFVTRKKLPVNSIHLDITEENFNLLVKLEGSNNQYKWYEILSDYRITGISNDFVKYSYSNLSFPDTQYKYYRVSWASDFKSKLNSASLTQYEKTEGNWMLHNNFHTVHEDDASSTTVIDINLEQVVPVSKVTIEVADSYNYYRPFTIQKIIDSTLINDEWRIFYSDIYSDILSSLEEPVYVIPEVLTNRFRVVVKNHDNEPLTVKGISVEGEVYKLIARFPDKAQYYLYYDNKNAEKPNYDIKYFEHTIPDTLTALNTGSAEQILDDKTSSALKRANKLWLWIVMSIIVVVLGGFTIHLIRSSHHE